MFSTHSRGAGGIPHADALLRLASLGLSRILAAIPEVPLEGVRVVVEEVDAAEMERAASKEARERSERVGKAAEAKPAPKVEPCPPGVDPYAKMRQESQCIIM